VVKTWEPRPADSSGPFDYRLMRMSGLAVPTSLLHVTGGFFDGLYVSTAEVVEAYDPPPTSTIILTIDGTAVYTAEVN
jgi:hypothetical protein